MATSMEDLTLDQIAALEVLRGNDNVFVTGAAGSGKSFLLRHYLSEAPDTEKTFPILASTGAAAILVGGRTFHSFFGLGILEGGVQPTIDRALAKKKLIRRLQQCQAVIIDEISMISGTVLRTAESIARRARGNERAWGGIRVIAVGDFAQLPPVNPFSREKDWAFLDAAWQMSEFRPAVLGEIVRTDDPGFLDVLNAIRLGEVTEEVSTFLERRTIAPPADFAGTRLFSRRDDVERFNLERLGTLTTPLREFTTYYAGKSKAIEDFKRHAPIPEIIRLKEGSLIMIRQNDVEGRWVNGSLGHVKGLSETVLTIELLSGREVEVEKTDFTLLDADGTPVVTATNFPVNLAWAVTIHKAQGTTLDRMVVDLRSLWEPGQAYVALSRVRKPRNLYLTGWHPRSIFADPAVRQFHQRLVSSD